VRRLQLPSDKRNGVMMFRTELFLNNMSTPFRCFISDELPDSLSGNSSEIKHLNGE